jgi:lipoate-protein ligase A
MYSVVLSLGQQGALRKIDIAHRYVMSRILRAIQTQIPEVQLQGICDLTWNEQKFSGNSLRIGRDYLLYHGTILYSFDLQFLHRCLKFAPRQPEYRQGRSHLDFVTNIVIDPNLFVDEIKAVFEVAKTVDSSPYHSCMRQLRLDRYDDCKWHNRH